MKILYLSCHSVLEYDELSLLTELDETPTVEAGLGIEVFSLGGAYMNPTQSGDHMRPTISKGRHYPELYAVAIQCSKESIHPEIIDWCDVVLTMHNPSLPFHTKEQEWLANNFDLIQSKGRTMIWRSIGQSTPSIELALTEFRRKGLKIVRYSPIEEKIPNYAGADAIIRFGKDSAEFNNWSGEKPVVITTAQRFMSRKEHLGYNVFDKVTQGYQRKVFGTENENLGDMNGGWVSYERLKQEMRENRVFYYYGTQPAPYTLGFIEAMMTGIPIVAVGKALRSSDIYSWEHYEIPSIIENERNGFISDDIGQLRKYIDILLYDHERAKAIGVEGRKTAIQLFDRLSIMRQWRDFLRRL